MGTLTQFMAYGAAQLGKPYSETLTGGVGPNHYDCSGLVQQMAKAAGLSIARTTESQWLTGQLKHVGSPIRGDLIYFQVPADGGSPPQHVGIYCGPGIMLEAPHTGTVVRYSSIPNSSSESIYGYRRLTFSTPTPPPEETMAITNDWLIRECFRQVLLREVDPGGYATFSAFLAGGGDPGEMYASVQDSPEGQTVLAAVRKANGL